VLAGLGLIAVAVAGVIALIAYFNAHDAPTTKGSAGGGLGVADSGSSSAQLRAGNVILDYTSRADLPKLRAIARTEAGTDHPDQSLIAAGQAVIIGRTPGGSGVTARAYHRTLHAPSAQDPAVEDFVSAYLGQGGQ
jgi:hypothetical protein